MKNWIFVATFLAGILIGSVIINVNAQNSSTKVKWEYKVDNFAGCGAMEKALNKMALEGWELAASSGAIIIFKREVPN